MKTQLKQTLLGLVIGITGNVFGFVCYGFILGAVNEVSFSYFYENMFLNTEIFRSQIFTGALLINVLIFYYFMKKGNDAYTRGIMLVILLTVIAIVYYYQ